MRTMLALLLCLKDLRRVRSKANPFGKKTEHSSSWADPMPGSRARDPA
jgi:hypothetical protein